VDCASDLHFALFLVVLLDLGSETAALQLLTGVRESDEAGQLTLLLLLNHFILVKDAVVLALVGVAVVTFESIELLLGGGSGPGRACLALPALALQGRHQHVLQVLILLALPLLLQLHLFSLFLAFNDVEVVVEDGELLVHGDSNEAALDFLVFFLAEALEEGALVDHDEVVGGGPLEVEFL